MADADIKIKLAHPIELERGPLLQFPEPTKAQKDAGEYGTGNEVKVPQSTARTLISAGYVVVDVEDAVAVATLLKVPEAEAAHAKAVVKDRLATTAKLDN